jgi:hypothetical protein
MQVDPIKPTLTAPGIERLKLKSYQVLSSFAFNFNLRRCTLVMAPMWALTGQSDLRVEAGATKALTKTDVVNDDAKQARVRLEGAVDGSSWQRLPATSYNSF